MTTATLRPITLTPLRLTQSQALEIEHVVASYRRVLRSKWAFIEYRAGEQRAWRELVTATRTERPIPAWLWLALAIEILLELVLISRF